MDAKEAAEATTRIVQDMAYKLSDLCERYPEGAACSSWPPSSCTSGHCCRC